MISRAGTGQAVTALPEETGSAFKLLLHFRNLTPSHATVKENNSKACTDVYFLGVWYEHFTWFKLLNTVTENKSMAESIYSKYISLSSSCKAKKDICILEYLSCFSALQYRKKV